MSVPEAARPRGDVSAHHGRAGPAEPLWAPEIVQHLTVALCGHVRRRHQQALAVPREVEELATFLVRLARVRQDPSTVVSRREPAQDGAMPDRLLVTKGEAARRLGVSVRTIERLVAGGRLPQVHVERLARFRVADLEAFADGLVAGTAPDCDTGAAAMGHREEPCLKYPRPGWAARDTEGSR